MAVSGPENESEPRTAAIAAHCFGVTHSFRAIPRPQTQTQVLNQQNPSEHPTVLGSSPAGLFLTHTEMQPSTSVIRSTPPSPPGSPLDSRQLPLHFSANLHL